MDHKNKTFLGRCPNPLKCRCLSVSFSGEVLENLKEVQREILHYLVVDFETPKSISNYRETSHSATKNIIAKLRKKGLIDNLNRPIKDLKTYKNNLEGSPSLAPQNSEGLYRVHSEHHTISLKGTSARYLKFIDGAIKKKEIEKNTIMFHRRKIVVYSNTSFYDDVPDEAFEKSSIYWHNFFLGLQSNHGIKIYDGENTDIRRFKCHIAKTNDPLAKKVITHNLKYKFIDDLGRGRLEIDNSKGLYEFEAICNETCQDDINIIKDYQGDLITKDHYVSSEVKKKIDDVEKNLKLITENLGSLTIMGSNQLKFNDVNNGQIKQLILLISTLTREVRDIKDGRGDSYVRP